MSSYAIRIPRARTARLKRKKAGGSEFLIVLTGGWCRVDPGWGKPLKGFRLWLFLPRPHETTLVDEKYDELSVECSLVSVTPWLAWHPWRLKFVADDPVAGRRFVDSVQAREASA